MNNTYITTKLCDTLDSCVYGITVDDNGIIYFTTWGENVYQVDYINSEPRTLVSIKGAMLRALVWNGNNILYICDYHNGSILSYSIDTGNLSTVVGKYVNTNDEQIGHSEAITLGKNGDLYTTEEHCVQKINISSGTVTTIAGFQNEGSFVYHNRPDHRDGEAKQATFWYPFGIAVSEDDTIYVADWHNHCIRKIKDGMVSTIAGTPGEEGYQDGPLSHSQFANPRTLVLDVDGNLLIGDMNGLRRVDLNQQIVSTLQVVSKILQNSCSQFAQLFIKFSIQVHIPILFIIQLHKPREGPGTCCSYSQPTHEAEGHKSPGLLLFV